MNDWYCDDLAYIHDVGYRDYALKSAPGILDILAQNNIREGLIIDLGCGSGLSASVFTKAGYGVFGVDISASLIAIARTRVPQATFQVESLFKATIPSCQAVVSIGECFNYLFDSDNNSQTLIQLFERIYASLTSGGLLIFDIAEPGQVETTPTKNFTEGEDWVVLVEKEENRDKSILTRRIITFRKVGEDYRRDDEVHLLQLYKATDVAKNLHEVGFQVQVAQSYGKYNLPTAHVAFIARKPQ